jgi:SAM-dependent methyltransferase
MLCGGALAAARLEGLAAAPLAGALLTAGAVALVQAALMVYSSRRGKLRFRDRLLDALGLVGHERVLDVGCGHGLLLIGAAKRLTQGRAEGIDLWSQKDQARNTSLATLANARIEGVEDRVMVHDGDMRQLPFRDGTFDAVVAHFAIHNVRARDGRRLAIREIVRVLKPSGRVAIGDLQHTEQYADDLDGLGMLDVEVSPPSFAVFPPARMVRARKPAD